ncbi:hypothetical protein Bbelb_159450 [Branchiostoma belcheri]|nr:hypothetical protein Bbelb_159450 [Branchiostoma belcheri]
MGRVTSDWREASANSGRGITRSYNYVGGRQNYSWPHVRNQLGALTCQHQGSPSGASLVAPNRWTRQRESAVALSRLFARVGSASAGSRVILRQPFWIVSSESDRCLGSSPQTGLAYSRIGQDECQITPVCRGSVDWVNTGLRGRQFLLLL